MSIRNAVFRTTCDNCESNFMCCSRSRIVGIYCVHVAWALKVLTVVSLLTGQLAGGAEGIYGTQAGGAAPGMPAFCLQDYCAPSCTPSEGA